MLLKDQMEKQGIWLFRFRGILPLIVLGFGLYEYLQTELYPELYPLEETACEVYFEMFCLAVSFLGLAVRIITVGHTPANTSGRNVKEQVADQLNTTGMYSVVRNPLYLGNFLIWFGISLLTMNVWFIAAFVFVYWIYYERIIFAEEQYLARKFGAAYKDWAAETPCFIPRFSGYKKAKYSFSWKKAVKKEKNGLLALLLVFSLFDIAGELIVNEPPKYMTIAIITAITIVAYFIIKYIKRHTMLLEETGR
jgi:protein-S-isoprenylcysteine O-methyltransferase Ste14